MKSKKPVGLALALMVVIVLSGIGSGYALAKMKPASPAANTNQKTTIPSQQNEIKVGEIYGDKDENKFPDTVEGIIVKGGFDGEGSHHLVRPGGKSQYVYLTSSVVDLDVFLNTKVAIRGETFSAQKAGWLMDVGQIKVLELNVANPDEAAPPAAE